MATRSSGQRAFQATAASVIGVGGSPFTYTNVTNFLQQVVVSGGTVSIISLLRGGVTGVITGGVFMLAPGDAITVTYAVAPTVMNSVNLI